MTKEQALGRGLSGLLKGTTITPQPTVQELRLTKQNHILLDLVKNQQAEISKLTDALIDRR